jgi:putative FmdB family regulatory protein
MPIYEYVCTACGKYSEALQRLSDPPLVECPGCHAQALIKQVSAAGFRLKGGGWYETDFKSDGKRNLADGGAEKPEKAEKTEKAGGADNKTSESASCGAGACPACAPAPASSAPTST